MAEYSIEIIETLSRIVVCPAASLQQAVELVRRQYQHGDIVLDADDFEKVDFEKVDFDREIPNEENHVNKNDDRQTK